MDIISFVLERNGFSSLNPVQQLAVEKGLLEDKNMVISSPTASGKTLIAEITAIKAINERKKVVYTCPLRALASEHFKAFKEKYPEFKAALSIGDYDSADPWLERYDIIFTTYEKLDSLLRHGAAWIEKVGLLIVDEIHEIDSERGPTIEIVTTHFLRRGSRILALSATIPNAEEIASWLNAELVVSNWRPVKLREGAFFGGIVYFQDGEEYMGGKDWKILVRDALDRGKQVLIFVNTRKQAEKLAKNLAATVSRYVKERGALENVSSIVLSALETPTSQCKALAECVKNGVAFHHAGLVHRQREVIEEAFRQGHLKVIVATPTLAAGVNLPAFRVIIHSLYRYTGAGSQRITVREYKQMVGRAGRPKYDRVGEGIVVTRSMDELQAVLARYINGTPEDVISRLGSEPVLRFHLLALIASFPLATRESIIAFFSSTFFGTQYGSHALENRIQRVLRDLEGMGFIKMGDTIQATRLGARVAQLYIDPLTAYNFVLFSKSPRLGEVPLLYTLVDSTELFPYLPVRRGEEETLWAQAYELMEELPKDAFEDPYLLNKIKLLLVLQDWINEVGEDEILEKYDVSPGILRGKVEIASWLAYSLSEIARLLDSRSVWRAARNVERRLKYGVKEELLPLVSLPNIGRVRARKLFENGIKSIEDVIRAPIGVLERVLGPKIARKVKEAAGAGGGIRTRDT